MQSGGSGEWECVVAAERPTLASPRRGVDALSRFRQSKFNVNSTIAIPHGSDKQQSHGGHAKVNLPECNSADQINEWYLSGGPGQVLAVLSESNSNRVTATIGSHDLVVPAGELGRLCLESHWSLGALLVPAIRLLAGLDQGPDVKLWELWRTVASFPSGTGGPENDVMGDFWLWQPEQCGVFVDGNRQARLCLPLMPSTRFIWDALVRCRWCGGPVTAPSGQLRPNCL